MKKLSRILLVVLIIGLLATVFSACSVLSKFQYQAPSDVSGGQGTSSGEKYDEEYPAYLKFTYKTQSPSVFKHIYIDEFNLEDVQYQVVYYVNKTDPQTDDFYEGYITKEDPQPVTKDMLDAASQKNLKVAGHHMIFVSTTIVFNGEETDVEGSFVLHLKERSQTEFVTFTFNLNGGNALFGSTADDVATISVIKGTSYSASDFFSTFNAVKDGYALAEWTGFSGNITADGDKTFTAKWTSDVIKVTFDLNLPDGVAGNPSAYTSEPVVPAPQNVQKNKGLIPRPSIETFATLTGYSFVGWFTSKTGGENWNFNESVGSVDMTLYAQWEVKTCSVTYILMGGVFDEAKSDTTATIKVDGKISYVNGYKEGEAGYNPDLTSNLMTDYPFMFTVEGMTYNQPYANYYAEFAPKRDSESLFKVNASPENLISQLKKGDNYYYISGWYESPTYEEESRYTSDKVSGNVVLYAKWEINPEILNPTTTAQIEKSEKYFGEYLYSYSVKADGSVRIDMVRDSAISTLVIPEKIDGKPVSEFGAQAGMNLKSLVKVDATKATSLVSIGKQAFYNSYALKEVEVATNIEYVGEDAFKGTQWLDSLAEEGSFAVVGSVLIKCFDFESESVNIDTALPELANVKIIAGGAFKDYYLLKSVTIGDGIKQIDNGAFYNCIALETVNGANGVENVGETAFGNTKFITTAPEDDIATADVDESTFIKIGKVYYRHIAATDKNTVIPAVQYIAPHAFITTPNVETIRFEDASQIINVGEEAFSGTLWLSEDRSEEETSLDGLGNNGTYIKDGFIVINHILVGYTKKIVNNGEQNWSVAFVPSNIKVIASHAFSGYSNAKLTNIVIPGGALEKIESEAFYGATSLARISFTETSGAALVEIFDDTFSGANGELVSESLKIYLYADALSVVPETDVWKTLYENSLDAEGKSTLFRELKTENVSINANIVPSVYVYDGVGAETFFLEAWDNAGILDAAKEKIVNGVVIRRSDQVQSIEDLPVKDFGNGQGYEKESRVIGGGTAFTVLYADKQVSYGFTIYPAIKEDTIKLYKNGAEINASNPLVFYNTQLSMDTTGLELRFEYNAVVGGSASGKLNMDDDMVEYSGYSIAIGDNKPLSVSINYFDLMKYNKTFVYSTKLPADAAIEQASTLTLALDSNPTASFNNVQLLITREDGTKRYETLSSRNAKVISYEDYLNKEIQGATADEFLLDTSTVGFKFAGVRYGDGKGNFIYCKLVYSVILSADAKQFTYQIVNADEHTAVVKGIKSGYDTTVTIPVTVMLNSSGVVSQTNSELYTIVGIANGAFEGCTALEYIYIPATVTEIGNDAFSGCTSLKNVYSFAVQDGEVVLGENDIEVLSATETPDANGVITGEVMIKDNLVTSDTIVVIPSIVEFTKDDIIYRYTVSALSKNAFAKIYDYGCRQIYLPSSLEVIDGTLDEVFGGHASDIEVFVYDSAENAVFYSVERFSSNIVKIGDRAFYQCSALENLDLSEATALEQIGSNAFYGCESMTAIDLSATSVTDISASMFASCTKLETVTLAAGTQIIENNAFENCLELVTVNGAGNVWLIGNQAFHACAKFSGISITSAIVGQSAFEGCDAANIAISYILVANENAISAELEDYQQATGVKGAAVKINGVQVTINGIALTFKTAETTSFNYEGAQTEYLVFYK